MRAPVLGGIRGVLGVGLDLLWGLSAGVCGPFIPESFNSFHCLVLSPLPRLKKSILLARGELLSARQQLS